MKILNIVIVACIFTACMGKGRLPCKENVDCPTEQICQTKNNGIRRCITPMKQAGPCKEDPFWVCAKGLSCKQNVCTKIIKEGEPCAAPATECKAGLICAVKSPTVKKCIRPMPIGGKCKRDPFWVCKEGLKCVDGTCKKEVSEGQSCVSQYVTCAKGLVCSEVGVQKRKRCVSAGKRGKACGAGLYLGCEKGLKCLKGICVELTNVNDECASTGKVCRAGLVCAEKSPTYKKCVEPKDKGMKCQKDVFWVCKPGLQCVDGVCL